MRRRAFPMRRRGLGNGMGRLDHIIVSAGVLSDGATRLEAQLRVPLQAGGTHAAMGTHNRLLSLGPDEYLELIAINPDGTPPDQPRWYNLDHFTGAPKFSHWAMRVDDLDAALERMSVNGAKTWDLARGDLKWRMAIPLSGQSAYSGLFPMLLQWTSPHPAPKLEDKYVRLNELRLFSPEATALKEALAPLIDDDRLRVMPSDGPRLEAILESPTGLVALSDVP